MKRLIAYLLCVLVAVLPACRGFDMTPEHRQVLLQQAAADRDAGHLTREQYEAVVEALQQQDGVDWEGLGLFGLNALLALLGAPMIVRRMRGPPTQKVGLPEDKVHK